MKKLPFSVHSLLLAGLVAGAAACTAEAADEHDSNTSAIVAPASPVVLSDDATGAARALLQVGGRAVGDMNEDTKVAYGTIVLSKIVSVHVADGADGRTFYLDGTVNLDGTAHANHAIFEERSTMPEWGPSFSAKLTAEAAPATARALSAAEVRVVDALVSMFRDRLWAQTSPSALALMDFAKYDVMLDEASVLERADGTATLTFEGSIMEGGDMVVGSATMTAEKKVDPDVTYDITTKRATY